MNSLLRAVRALLLLLAVFVAVPFAITQQHPGHQTHQYKLSDPALAAAAQRYDWA